MTNSICSQTFAGPFLLALATDEEREEVVQEVEEFMQPDCYDAATKEWTVMCELFASKKVDSPLTSSR